MLTANMDRCQPRKDLVERLNSSHRKDVLFLEEPDPTLLPQLSPAKTFWLRISARELFHRRPDLPVELVFDGTEGHVVEILAAARTLSLVKLTIKPLRRSFHASFTDNFSGEEKSRLHFEFVPYDARVADSWTVPEIAEMIRELQACGVNVLPPPGYDVIGARQDVHAVLPRVIQPLWITQIPGSQIEWSVIVPAYNNAELLPAVLWNLLAQDLPRKNFEIILIDDGSEDQTCGRVREFLNPEASELNFKLLRIEEPHVQGDGHSTYRAGLARNLGYQHSCGKNILFVDSDTVIDRELLERYSHRLETHDLIQSVRRYANWNLNEPLPTHSDLLWEPYWLEEKNYHEPFYQCEDWLMYPCPWKYVATYTLAVKRSHIEKLGLFRSTFSSYGFEDVELGYRWWRNGAKFFLDRTPVYHLSCGPSKRRGLLNKMFRHYALSDSGKTLFHNTLDLDVYWELYPYMWGESRTLRWLYGKTLKTWV